MQFETMGNSQNPAVLFFHAMGVVGASSKPVAEHLQGKYFCIMPTSSAYCEGQRYLGKSDEIAQVEAFLHEQGVRSLALVTASSIGADLALAFLAQTKLRVEHAFFDGGQFAQINRGARRAITPLLYLAIKSLYWTQGGSLKKILWCSDETIKPYFISAGKALRYGNLHRQLADSLEDKNFPTPDRGVAGTHILRVREHRGSFQVPCRRAPNLPARKIPGIQRLQPHAIPDQRSRRLRTHAADHHPGWQNAGAGICIIGRQTKQAKRSQNVMQTCSAIKQRASKRHQTAKLYGIRPLVQPTHRRCAFFAFSALKAIISIKEH